MKKAKKILNGLGADAPVFFESREAFLKGLLDSASRFLGADRVSFYYCDEKHSLLRLMMRRAGGIAFEAEENVRLSPESPASAALGSLKPVVFSNKAGHFLLAPFRIEIYSTAARREAPIQGLIRLERSPGKRRFSRTEAAAAHLRLGDLMRSYYKAEFVGLNKKYDKNLGAITELTEIFANSLRVRESFKHILTGIQTYFGFDRVRLYLIDEKAEKLKGELSSDIRGQIKSIAYEEIPLEAGAHRFADIVLGKSSGVFMERYKDCVLYLPLIVQGVTIGLLIVDNLLSQQKIEPGELAMLKSFAGQIGLALDNVRLFDKVEELSLYDELTKLPLRRYFNQRYQEEFYRAERFKQPLAMIWADIDYFKEVNDTYGHQIGDQVLKEVGRVVLSNLRKIDFPCRYGGDEILILLPQAAGEEAEKLARRLSAEIREIKIPVPFSRTRELSVSVSLGISTFPADARSTETLLEKADDALYWVKSHGRGGIALAGEVAKLKGQ
ncbi:MAG: sensor domain-containing diguanylate cyclase [Elusimicrobiales bacterium]|jgi:diguanylate cyclase (GGDEF)-like protein